LLPKNDNGHFYLPFLFGAGMALRSSFCMNAYQNFRLFYNQTIHPELVHLEQRRQRLVRLLLLSIFLFAGVLALQAFIGVFLFTLLLLIPVGVWIAYIAFKIDVFFKEFKPRIMALILDFIDNDVNYFFKGYDNKGFIPQQWFLESRIFTNIQTYRGEDMVTGQIRETPFVFSELEVRELSEVRTKLDYVFRGVFMIADFKRWDMRGSVLILPDAYMKYLSRSEKQFHLMGGKRVKKGMLPEFETFFNVYATEDVRLQDVLSEEMQRSILQFRLLFQQKNREKEIYLSIIADKIYIALTQDKDLLEPQLFSSNVSYEVVNEFYEDIRMLLDIVLDVDNMN
jgi:Protein of unknown function (DUF3137)